MPAMAGSSSREAGETTSDRCASGNLSRNAAIDGVVRMRSPIRLSWRRRMFISLVLLLALVIVIEQLLSGDLSRAGARARLRVRSQLAPLLHRDFISDQQPGPEMIPGEV